jgi:2-amino-4-hydroxy-6-hydroxymethyldihydropteridine diphosphokinase
VKTVFIALGSNLGDRLEHLEAGSLMLERHPEIRVLEKSVVFETEPFGVTSAQGAYLNAVAKLETSLSAQDLLTLMLEIEHSRGRERFERFGARTLDLDILLYGSEKISIPNLEIPHPRILERAFVLAPLTDLAADLEIPGTGFTVQQALQRLDTSSVWATELEF